MAKKGDRVIGEDEIVSILDEEGIASACFISRRLNKNYVTARKRCEELVESKRLEKIQHNSGKYTNRLYKLNDELEQTTNTIK